MSSWSMDLEVKDSDPLPAMPKITEDELGWHMEVEGSEVKWLGFGPANR